MHVAGTGEAEEGLEHYASDDGRDVAGRSLQRLVVKVGSRLLAGRDGALHDRRIGALSEVIAAHRPIETVLVSSGAVVTGFSALGRRRAPTSAAARRAAAAVGQAVLIRRYAELFGQHGIEIGQMLLTRDVLIDRRRSVEAGRTLEALLDAGILPIVNENDPLGTLDHAVGDNDNLAAHVATMVGADLLVILTDVEGVYASGQGAEGRHPIPRVESAAELRRYCWSRPSPESRGGMVTKLEAAERAGRAGVPTVIASGLDPEPLAAIYAGRDVGTRIETVHTAVESSPLSVSGWSGLSRNGVSARQAAPPAASVRVAPGGHVLANGTEGVR
jgi:glutamate 5-kinase